jgi:uncharacterized coiled-coil protein SlyX
MGISIPQTRLFLTPIIVILGIMTFTQASPAVASSSSMPSTGVISGCGSNNNYGCTYWWDWALIGNMIPGQTVYFSFNLYNTAPSGNPVTIDTLTVQTPWANYTDPSLPLVIDTGYNYYNEIAITIPVNQAPGSVQGSLQFTGEFSDGDPWCSSTGNVCSDSASFAILANPTTLQTQVTSLNASVSTLNAQITALNAEVSSFRGQITSLNNQIAALTTQLSQANGNLSMSKQTIVTDQEALTQAQSELATAKSSLASDQAQLASEEAQLASTQSNLNRATDGSGNLSGD